MKQPYEINSDFFKKMIFCSLSQDLEKRKPSVPISLENKREGFSFPNIV